MRKSPIFVSTLPRCGSMCNGGQRMEQPFIPQEQQTYLRRHLALSDRLLQCIDQALDNPMELYRPASAQKAGQDEQMEPTLDDRKLLNLVKAVGDLKDIQRQALGILEEKDRQRLQAEQGKAAEGEGLRQFLLALDAGQTEARK